MLAPSWPKHFGTWTFLDRNPVCHGWGRAGSEGQAEGNRKGDMTSRKGHAAVPSPEQHHQESGSLYFWAFLQRNSHPKGSDLGGVTCVSCLGGCSKPPDSPLDQGPFLPLSCTGLAPDVLNLVATKTTLPPKDPFSWWLKILAFSPWKYDQHRGQPSGSCQKGSEGSG